MNPCKTCALSRRQFLRTAGGVIGAWMLLPLAEPVFAAPPDSRTPIFPKGKPRVAVVFSHVPPEYPTWPSVGYDYEGRKKELAAKLQESCPNIRFTFHTALNAQQAEAMVKEAGENIDGFVCYNIGIWTGAPNVLAHSGKPVVMVDDLFAGSGETLIIGGVAHRENLPVVTVSSSRFEDVADAVRLFRSDSRDEGIHHSGRSGLRHQWMGWWRQGVVWHERGPNGFRGLASYYAKADESEAARWADLWMKQAKKVVEPSREEIIQSGKMYSRYRKPPPTNVPMR